MQKKYYKLLKNRIILGVNIKADAQNYIIY
jgi:hypothetical protein